MPNRQQAMLNRLHRVRTLQLNLTMAEESRAQQRVTTERQLSDRIAQLVEAVAPTPTPPTSAAALMARAHFRHRLNESSDAAASRVAAAEHQASRAAEQTRDAKRDQTAVEKLLERARAAAIRAEMRALEDMPAASPRRSQNRHDPC
ncbi:hypothetical protein [Sphingomonas sp. Marseille-Q8236]|jgi:hypothetical protein